MKATHLLDLEVSLSVLPPPHLARSLSSIQMADGRAVSMTTGRATTGWATSRPPWERPLSSEQASPIQAWAHRPEGSECTYVGWQGKDQTLAIARSGVQSGIQPCVLPVVSSSVSLCHSFIYSTDIGYWALGTDDDPDGHHFCSQGACPLGGRGARDSDVNMEGNVPTNDTDDMLTQCGQRRP